MKCPKCKSKKKMGNTHVIDKEKQVVPSWLCTFCGCNVIKTKELLYQVLVDAVEEMGYTNHQYVIPGIDATNIKQFRVTIGL